MNPQPAQPLAGAGLAMETLARFGQLRLRATGGSMLPAITAGDLLAFRACTPTAMPQIGQVVLLRQADRLLIHRLVEMSVNCVTTRGDALSANDMPVPHSQVLGVLVSQQRGPRTLPTGGRHWLARQRISRMLIQRFPLVHRACSRFPRIVELAQ